MNYNSSESLQEIGMLLGLNFKTFQWATALTKKLLFLLPQNALRQ